VPRAPSLSLSIERLFYFLPERAPPPCVSVSFVIHIPTLPQLPHRQSRLHPFTASFTLSDSRSSPR